MLSVHTIEQHKKEIINQVNASPEPLREYIHSLSVGPYAELLFELEALRNQNTELLFLLNRKADADG